MGGENVWIEVVLKNKYEMNVFSCKDWTEMVDEDVGLPITVSNSCSIIRYHNLNASIKGGQVTKIKNIMRIT